ncbi:hypothetical protein APS_0244 [Acetobacter pasteurianus subsp. pasteurianus LMG 1262 = NBRC 106471]|uniref:DUF2125 domain-containing protein n=1 Tax=Acetobacter pasteurianus TaxID=438 RepID=UPI000245772B|nr:DUF2125 domain-containing protein [Acetobacter pasteurianus]GAB29642.1 hypothetical protein APS_0244 [Acetobacter pasteurianus subsp. pasteurianus LMG 1262 = NBRC 106471]GCD49166.1 hypothetical protein NBRC106471_0722 [Acetobacter pasteurianus subsp. pasteurianus LMG 1262 = NBRC 106471]
MKKKLLSVAVGASGCFLVLSGYWWASAQYLQKQADNMPSGCQAHYSSRAVNGWPWYAQLDTQNMRMVCTPLLAARSSAFQIIYAAARVAADTAFWRPFFVHVRLISPMVMETLHNEQEGEDAPVVLRMEGDPIELDLPLSRKAAGHAVFQAPFLHVLFPAGASHMGDMVLQNVRGKAFWNMRATQEQSTAAVFVKAQRWGITGWQTVLEHVQAAIAIPGPTTNVRESIFPSSGAAAWPDVLVQRFTAHWRDLNLNMTGQVRGGELLHPTGDFWLSVANWQPFLENLRREGTLSAQEATGMATMLARVTREQPGNLQMPLMLRNGTMQLGTLPVSALQPVFQAARHAAQETAAQAGRAPAN